MESEEDAEMLFGPAPGPSCSRRAIPQHDDNEAIVISNSELESEADSRDIVGMGKVSLSLLSSLPLSLICLSFATGKAMGLGCWEGSHQWCQKLQDQARVQRLVRAVVQ